ncbi:MAG: Sec-independent protein translocase protein TatB [Pyrinomonadaceae bacterium]
MFLLIFESIGTSELILVGLVALIIFGPRKLPEMMRSFGKAMAEFRRSTNEFKESWEREVNLESLTEENSKGETSSENLLDASISRKTFEEETKPVLPEIKEISGEDFQLPFPEEKETEFIEENTQDLDVEKSESNYSVKRDWL